MTRDILAQHPELFLGSRLKRLAERLQADAARIMCAADLPIQPAHFPLLAAIDSGGPATVTELGAALGISQPSITRSVRALLALGLIEPAHHAGDLRLKPLALTAAGAAVMARGKALVWPPVTAAVAELCAGLEGDLLTQLSGLEARLDQRSLLDRVGAPLRIREYTDDLAGEFERINAEWIASMFTLEDNDRKILGNPRETIIDRGGIILFVEAPGIGIIGTCALMRIDDTAFELTKMAVTEAARGRKAGEFLLAVILERAAAMQIETLYLLTNTKCGAAIHLYEKLGFDHDADIMQRYGARYERCNVAMSIAL
ncbi:MarR family transcriptional regulator [Polymorphobacter glacialis]|uniref:MarR family transcriptional regulator n=1 Tax=Sandarakinorhabdus glacialis TaxID=1614636 RepID=A0A917EAD1_9SPHN|nr:bifunctional helix-turn-helix transcriptional regulator/GNAT family N-acetyltransferase [Polymorphobacter glacialis]GGE14877.1 MarR family transcriptional regulator [Polymorphobacter glacialis]